MNARREEYVIGMADEFGEISVRVSVPATEGQKVLSEHDREMLAGKWHRIWRCIWPNA